VLSDPTGPPANVQQRMIPRGRKKMNQHIHIRLPNDALIPGRKPTKMINIQRPGETRTCHIDPFYDWISKSAKIKYNQPLQ
jgi:hypothetical protein